MILRFMRDGPMTSALQMSKQEARRQKIRRPAIGVGLLSHGGVNKTGSIRKRSEP